MTDAPKLGQIITGPAERDAVHVAIAPVTAGERLLPGQRVAVIHNKAYRNATPVGIVDPFLREPVEPGDRFYVWLFPGTITSLRHSWSHPAFDPVLPVNEEAHDRR